MRTFAREQTFMGDPRVLAQELGIDVCCSDGLPFLVGSDATGIIYRWDACPMVRDERVWEGIAQCVLTRAGIPWSERRAKRLALKLSRIRLDMATNAS